MDTPAFRIVVPGPPRGVQASASRVVTSKKTGRHFAVHYTPTQTRNELAVIRDFAEQAMGGRAPLKGALELRFSAFLPIPKSMSKRLRAEALAWTFLPIKKPDFDNVASFIDALAKIAFENDNQIAEAHIYKRYSDRPRVIFELRVLGNGG